MFPERTPGAGAASRQGPRIVAATIVLVVDELGDDAPNKEVGEPQRSKAGTMRQPPDETEHTKTREGERQSVLTIVPRVAKFLWHLVKDPRVPAAVKWSLVGLAAYLASPIDLIPDWIPGAGYLDDVMIVGFVVSYVLARVSPEVVREHWGEDVEMLERLRRRKK